MPPVTIHAAKLKGPWLEGYRAFLGDDQDANKNMTTTVFIAGSRKISRLPAEIESRLDSIIEKGFAVVVGDADGADTAAQVYLAAKRYPKVTVYCVARSCRNNVGKWPTREIAAAPGAKGFEFYAAKDRAMAEVASHGLMLWDGKSKGTLTNIVNLTRDQKPVVVFVSPTRAIHTLRNERDLSALLRSSQEIAPARDETPFNQAG